MSTSTPIETPSRRRSRLRRWRVALVPVALATPLALVACGGTDDAAASGASQSSGANGYTNGQGSGQGNGQGNGQGGPNREAFQKYTACLQENGVTLPDRGEGGYRRRYGGQPPQGADGEMPQPPDGAQPPQGANGEMPQNGQGGPGGGGFMGLDTSDATVAAAMKACSDLQPQMPQGGPGQGQNQGQNHGQNQGQNQNGTDQQNGNGSTSASTTTTAVTN